MKIMQLFLALCLCGCVHSQALTMTRTQDQNLVIEEVENVCKSDDRIAQLVKLQFSTIYKLPSIPDKEPLCALLKDKWPDYLEQLQDLPQRSMHALSSSQKYLALLASACADSFTAVHQAVSDIAKLGSSYVNTFGFPSTLEKIFGGNLSQTDSTSAFAFFGDAVLSSAVNSECITRTFSRIAIPAEPTCMASWVFSRWNQNATLTSQPFSATEQTLARNKVEALAQAESVRSWSSLLSLPFPVTFQGSVPRYNPSLRLSDKILFAMPPSETASLLNNHAEELLPVLHSAGYRAPDKTKCSLLGERIPQILAALPAPAAENDPAVFAVLGTALTTICSTNSFAYSPSIFGSIPADYGYHSGMSRAAVTDPVLIVEGESLEDMRLREQLELRFPYGSYFDKEDLGNYSDSDKENALIDSVIFRELRDSDHIPWIHLSQNIEDLAEQQAVVQEVLGNFGKSNRVGKRLAQIIYLDGFDFAPELEANSQNSVALIKQIRELSQYLKALVPEFRHLGNQIHNGLHAGLIANIEQLASTLSAGQTAEHGKVLKRLQRLLSEMFWLNRKPLVRLQELANRVSDNSSLGAVISRLDDRTECSTQLPLLVELAQIAESRLSQADNNKTFDGNYVMLLRIRRDTHALFTECADNTLYLSYWESLVGKEIKSHQPVTQQVGEVLTNLLAERESRFLFFLLTQRYRLSQNEAIIESRTKRLNDLAAVIEKITERVVGSKE